MRTLPLLALLLAGCAGSEILAPAPGVDLHLLADAPKEGYVKNNLRYLSREPLLTAAGIRSIEIVPEGEEDAWIKILLNEKGRLDLAAKRDALESERITIVAGERLLLDAPAAVVQDDRIEILCRAGEAEAFKIILERSRGD